MHFSCTPWGLHRTLLEYGSMQNHAVKAKELVLKPLQKTSYQYHEKRTEIIIPLNGILRVDNYYHHTWVAAFNTYSVFPNENHQLVNPHDYDLHLLEIQYGEETSENDIVRLHDPHESVRKDYR